MSTTPPLRVRDDDSAASPERADIASALTRDGRDAAPTKTRRVAEMSARATHHDTCWRDHLPCAVRRVEELEARNAELEVGVAKALGTLQRAAEQGLLDMADKRVLRRIRRWSDAV